MIGNERLSTRRLRPLLAALADHDALDAESVQSLDERRRQRLEQHLVAHATHAFTG